MQLFNIGLPEILFFGIILIIVFKPENLPTEAKNLARKLRKIFRSDEFREVNALVKTIRETPERIYREINLEETRKEIAAFEESARAQAQAIEQQLTALPKSEEPGAEDNSPMKNNE